MTIVEWIELGIAFLAGGITSTFLYIDVYVVIKQDETMPVISVLLISCAVFLFSIFVLESVVDRMFKKRTNDVSDKKNN